MIEDNFRCPACGSQDMERVQKTLGDKILNLITFNLLELKRYRCLSCLWVGPISKHYISSDKSPKA
jgi:hypothetical protein